MKAYFNEYECDCGDEWDMIGESQEEGICPKCRELVMPYNTEEFCNE